MLPNWADYKRLTHRSLLRSVLPFQWIRLCGCISPCSPPSYPALFSSPSGATCLPSLPPPSAPVPVPAAFSARLPLVKPFPPPVLPTTLHRNLTFLYFICVAVGFNFSLFSHSYHKDHLPDSRRELCKPQNRNYPAWVSPYQARIAGQERERFHSGKLKTFLISHAVLQHIFKEPCLA